MLLGTSSRVPHGCPKNFQYSYRKVQKASHQRCKGKKTGFEDSVDRSEPQTTRETTYFQHAKCVPEKFSKDHIMKKIKEETNKKEFVFEKKT